MGDERCPVSDWAGDYDLYDEAFVADPYPIWGELRQSCPVAHSDRWGGSWMPTRYEDVTTIAHDTVHFSSVDVGVVPIEGLERPLGSPPITSDLPDHTWHRRLILPFFSPRAVDGYEVTTRALCRQLAGELADRGHGDAASGYAQQIPPRVIAEVLGVSVDDTEDFVTWVRGVLEQGPLHPEERLVHRQNLVDYFRAVVAERRERPGDDLISYLLAQTHDGQPLRDGHIISTCTLLLVAGIDTTWSSIGSALLHLATHTDDRRRLVEDATLLPAAVEELLRAYSPVTMARLVTDEVIIGGRVLEPGDRVLLTFPAANRDPAVFPDAEEVQLDRTLNRHVAFGVGIHRCAGSNLARMEMRVALEEWLTAIPEFRLAPDVEVTFAGGQVRGPRQLPLVFE